MRVRHYEDVEAEALNNFPILVRGLLVLGGMIDFLSDIGFLQYIAA